MINIRFIYIQFEEFTLFAGSWNIENNNGSHIFGYNDYMGMDSSLIHTIDGNKYLKFHDGINIFIKNKYDNATDDEKQNIKQLLYNKYKSQIIRKSVNKHRIQLLKC